MDMPGIIRGTWQLSQGHSQDATTASLLAALMDCIERGLSCFDTADIYTGAEDLLGQARSHLPQGTSPLRVHTKYVPDLEQLAQLTMEDVERIIDRSLMRLQCDVLDLVQFHWWDFSKPYYLEALHHLDVLRVKGKISRIGLTNFDQAHLQKVIDSGVAIYSMQCQMSLLDQRGQSIASLCQENGIHLLAYGSLAGGFLSARGLIPH